MALVLADGTAKGRADPAFDAHALPIGQWAQAVWHRWLPLPALNKIAAKAKLAVRLLQPSQLWRNVKGPAAAMVASAQRIGWTVCDATRLITDLGISLNLTNDPPIVVDKNGQ